MFEAPFPTTILCPECLFITSTYIKMHSIQVNTMSPDQTAPIGSNKTT